jgi:hypothetical protein
MSLSQIVFYSRNLLTLHGGTMRELVRDILASCNRYDRASGFTGALVFNETFFLQAMEGDPVALSDQLWTLAADSRHSGMVLIAARAIEQRDFRGWTVGYAGHTEPLETLYLRYGAKPRLDPTQMSVAGAVALLRAFTEVEGNHCVQRSGPAAAGAAKV